MSAADDRARPYLRFLPVAAAAAAWLVATACGQLGTGGVGSTGRAGRDTSWLAVGSEAELLYTDRSNFRQPITLVIRDRAAWDSAWAQLRRPGDPPQGTPAVDFEAESLLLVASGRAGVDDSVRIDSVAVVHRTLVVAYHRFCRPTVVPMLSNPAHVVRVPRVRGTVVFQESLGEYCLPRGSPR